MKTIQPLRHQNSRRGDTTIRIIVIIFGFFLLCTLVCCGGGYFVMWRFVENVGEGIQTFAKNANLNEVKSSHQRAIEQVEKSFLNEEEKKAALSQLDRMKTTFLREVEEENWAAGRSFATITDHRVFFFAKLRQIKDVNLPASGLMDAEKEDGKKMLAQVQCLIVNYELDDDDEYRLRGEVDKYLAVLRGDVVRSEEKAEEVIDEPMSDNEDGPVGDADVEGESNGDTSDDGPDDGGNENATDDSAIEDVPEDGNSEDAPDGDVNEDGDAGEDDSSTPEIPKPALSPDEQLLQLLATVTTIIESKEAAAETCEVDFASEISRDVDDYLRNR